MSAGVSFFPHGLIVDDDAGVLALATAVLSEEGYSVRSASSMLEGFARAVATETPLDFLVTDYELGSSTGTTLAAAVRSLHPRVRVLLISGSGRALGEIDECIDAFLPKPFTPASLRQAVARMMESVPAS